MDSYSQALQDLNVLEVIKDKGTYLDVGSADPLHMNNTYLLELNGWTGHCIDARHFDYSKRSCDFWNGEAVEMIQAHLPDCAHFNYISLDVDGSTNRALQALIDKRITFDFATVEHDKYLIGEQFQIDQRAMLHNAGYKMLFSDIYPHGNDPSILFEDWWVPANAWEKTLGDKLSSKMSLDLMRQR